MQTLTNQWISKAILPVVLYFTTVAASSTPLAVGRYEYKSRAARADFAVVVRVDQQAMRQSSGWMWGAEASNNGSSIVDIVATSGNQRIFVPLSAYSDLASPSAITLATQGATHILEIKGGDAATVYRARLQFSKGVLVRRSVESGEFPDQAREVTTYKSNTLKN